jgi:Protein of unknown function (DUF2949)
MRLDANVQLIAFLQQELSLSSATLETALLHSEKFQGPLPMVLWQQGLVSLKQLERIYDWLDQ